MRKQRASDERGADLSPSGPVSMSSFPAVLMFGLIDFGLCASALKNIPIILAGIAFGHAKFILSKAQRQSTHKFVDRTP